MTIRKQAIGNFRELTVYRKALLFNKEIYQALEKFPSYEKYNVVDQLRRASTSVVANISEGNANYYYAKEFDRLNSSLGSVAECRALLEISLMENYVSREEYKSLDEKAQEIMKMLIGMMIRIDQILNKN